MAALPVNVAMATSVTALAVDDAYVYWIDSASGSIVEADKTAATPTPATLSTGEPRPSGLASDGVYVYWSNYLGGAVVRKPRTGSPTDQLVSAAVQPTIVALDDTYAYWAELGPVVKRAPKDGSGVATTLATLPNIPVTSLVVDSAFVCWGQGESGGTIGQSCGGCLAKAGLIGCDAGPCASVLGLSGPANFVTLAPAFLVTGGYESVGAHLLTESSSYPVLAGAVGAQLPLLGGYNSPPNYVYVFTGSSADNQYAYLSWDWSVQLPPVGQGAGTYRTHFCGGGSDLLTPMEPRLLVPDSNYLYGVVGSTSIVRLPK